MKFSLDKFEEFLKNVDLEKYRNQYSKIKTVEMDLPKGVQALETIYDVYWNDGKKKFATPPTFEEYYKIYFKSCKEEIMKFWDNSGFGHRCSCFKNGLEARIFRTWASLITQIHAAYVAESVFGEGSVEQNVKMDHEDIDFLVTYKEHKIKIQVKKETYRKEIARMDDGSEKNKDINYIWYLVPPDFDKPKYVKPPRTGQDKEWVSMFIQYDKVNGFLNRFDNGFVVFTKKTFEDIKAKYDNL